MAITDTQLLHRFVAENDEDAFAELVQRRINLVYAAALRQVGADAHRAQDITQQVFIALAQQARELATHPSIVAWLYTTTHHLALKFWRAERRRKQREEEAHAMDHLTGAAPAANWERLRPVLDAAMHELNERDRRIVLLRFFDRQTFSVIGAELGLTENAAQKSAERALDRLHALLAKRGITSATAALSITLMDATAAAAPSGLAASVTGAALSGAAGAGAGTLATLLYFMSATKTIVGLGVAAALALGVGFYQSSLAQAVARKLAQEHADHVALKTQVAAHLARLDEAEKQRGALEAALVEAKAALSKLATSVAPAPDGSRANPNQALQQLLAGDPAFQQARADAVRAAFRARTAPFLRSLGFNPEQIERAVELHASLTAPADARIGPPDTTPPDPAGFLPQFRTLFGDAAAEKYAAFTETRRTAPIVNDLSAKLGVAGAPLSIEQAGRLSAVIHAATTPGTGGLIRNGVVDWERVFAQATNLLSPVQLQGLRAEAAFDRNQTMLAIAQNAGSTQ